MTGDDFEDASSRHYRPSSVLSDLEREAFLTYQDEQDLYARADDLWGFDAQLDVAVEELGELITEIQRWRRGRSSLEDVAGELADVDLVSRQLERYVGREVYLERRKAKLDRLKERIEGAEDL